jgi:hypothetical protein
VVQSIARSPQPPTVIAPIVATATMRAAPRVTKSARSAPATAAARNDTPNTPATGAKPASGPSSCE